MSLATARNLRPVGLVVLAALLASCAGVRYRYTSDAELARLLAGPAAPFPTARFAVLSDPHVYDTALGTTGTAFGEYLADDRKLLVESEELLSTAVEKVKALDVQFVLVPGDLTKDGERQDHELAARLLGRLRDAGIPVYVVPGNHDILNPRALSYGESGSARVPNVSPEEFAEIYRDFGYSLALDRDPASLSYVAEPIPGLRLLALDSCDYSENPKLKEPRTSGRFRPETVAWIEEALAKAARANVAVVAMMHHNIMEHYAGEEKHYGEYIVKDWRELSALLAAYHARIVFTGHYHAQDVTLRTLEGGRFIYDVETGSLVTAPDPIRRVEIDGGGRMAIDSSFVDRIPSFEADARDFHAYAEQYLKEGIEGIAIETMQGLHVPTRDATRLAPEIADAFAAHYNGDERFTGTEILSTRGLSLMGRLVVGSRRSLVVGLWHDLEPPDNSVVLDLASGQWEAAPWPPGRASAPTAQGAP